MTRDQFIEEAAALIERVQQSATGMLDHLGEKTPEGAARQIADLLSHTAFDE